MSKKFDFCGWATRNNVRCSDGRTIRQNAFADQDGEIVPLVWNHGHDGVSNVLGHALLKNREDGVYAYCSFNNSENAQAAKEAVRHGDVNALSIYANKLKEQAGNVMHGVIREVSLVLASANPEARIESFMAHNDMDDEEAVFYTATGLGLELSHSAMLDSYAEDEYEEDDMRDYISHSDKTMEEVIDTMDADQLALMEHLVGSALRHSEDEEFDDEEFNEDFEDGDFDDEEYDEKFDEEAPEDEEDFDGDDEEEFYDDEEDDMKHNMFDADYDEGALIHCDFDALNDDAIRMGGKLSEAVLAHAESNGMDEEEFIAHAAGDRYGIMPKMDGTTPVPGSYGIDLLFPDYKSLNNPPDWIKRDTSWVSGVMSGVHHTPFSRIKSMFADITEDDARARGYMKGNLKKEEVFSLLKRTTDPQTVYKKQKLDRDDIIDITDFDVVMWIKAEMRMMLEEEIARAILVGDGRLADSDDKIRQEHVRSIYNDDDFYSNKVAVVVKNNATDDEIAKATIRAAIKARKDYKGSGNPTFFTTTEVLTNMLLLEDGIGHRLYKTEAELATALRVSKIVEVEVMENLTRTFTEGTTSKTLPLIGIIVNLSDYNVGADKGGAVSMFDDFDIDYNQNKYLIETRLSGALIKPHSAMVLELDKSAQAQG